MFEPTFSLFQVLGLSLFACMFGMGLGIMMGKAVQRKHDIWMFGPKYMRKGKPPIWARTDT